jgi:ribokinase
VGRVAVIGDLMLDVLVEADGPLRPGDDTRGRITMQPGGQAANVAAWVAALGGQARLVCARAGDDSGERAADALRSRHVEVVGPVLCDRGGVVASIISPSGERALVSDPGCTRALRPEHLDGAWFTDSDCLHVSGYHLFDDGAADAALHAAELARGHGAQISLDLAYAARLKELGSAEALRRIDALGPDVVLQTEQEAEALGGPARAPVRVIKQGRDGCTVITAEQQLVLPAVEATVVDTTGAGDAFAAGFLSADGLRDGAQQGLSAAARCIAGVGAMPAVDTEPLAVTGARA